MSPAFVIVAVLEFAGWHWIVHGVGRWMPFIELLHIFLMGATGQVPREKPRQPQGTYG